MRMIVIPNFTFGTVLLLIYVFVLLFLFMLSVRDEVKLNDA